MIHFIFDFLENNGVCADSEQERTAMEAGIAEFLQENGIRLDEQQEYQRSFVINLLRQIDTSDLKSYLIHYHLFREVNQIATEVRSGENPSPNHHDRLYRELLKLNRVGLGKKYIPIIEIQQLLEKFS